MTERFFIEFRPWKRKFIREYAEGANRRLIKLGSEKINVPHMTLYGPSEAEDLDKIARRVRDIAKEFELVKVTAAGFSYFDNADKKWVNIHIKPNQKLEDLRYKLHQALCKMAPPQPWDAQPQYKFHVAIAKTTDAYIFNKIRHAVWHWSPPEIEQFLLRIAIINGHGKIHSEYDLIQKRLLTRREALSHWEQKKTLQGLRNLLSGRQPYQQRLSIFDKIGKFFSDLSG